MFYDEKKQIDLNHQLRLYELDNDILERPYLIYLEPVDASYYSLDQNDVRNYIFADMHARFLRLLGRNVLFSTGINNYAFDTYHLLDKDVLNFYNFSLEIKKTFQDELKYLDISLDFNKSILFSDDRYIEYVDKIFQKLFEANLIKYEDDVLVFDDTKIYHPFNYQKIDKKYYDLNYHLLKTQQKKVFSLDIKNYKKEIATSLMELNISDEYKKELQKMVGFYQGVEFIFETTMGKNFAFKMEDPEHLFGLSYIIINPSYLDISEYTDFDIEELRLTDVVYSGFDIINYFNGYQIPVFLSNKKEVGIYLGIPSLKEEDEFFASQYDLPYLPIFDYVGDTRILVNSLFLNSYTEDNAHLVMLEKSTKADIGSIYNDIKADKLTLSSNMKFGMPIPLAIPLSKTKIPLIYDNVNDIRYIKEGKIDKTYVKDFLNPDFVKSLFLNALIIFDDQEFIDYNLEYTKNKIKKIQEINRYVIMENQLSFLLWHLSLGIILADIYQEPLFINFKNIDILTIDKNKKTSVNDITNVLNISDLIDKYGSSLLRLYYLKNGFSKSKIEVLKLEELESELSSLFMIFDYISEEDKLEDILDGFFDEIKLDIAREEYELVYHKLKNIVDIILEDKAITLKNLKKLLMIYYIFFPSLTTKFAEEKTTLKHPIYYYSWE